MKFLDKVALNRFIKIITDFILSIIKIFATKNKDIVSPKPVKRPLKDLLDRVFNR